MLKLTPKQENFCLKYLELGNASEAYRQSYSASNMKPNTVEKRACELLKNGKIAGRLNELQGKAADAAMLDRAWVLDRLMLVVRIALGEEDEAAEFDLPAACRALELLGKTKELNLFVTRHEISGPNGEPVRLRTEDEARNFDDKFDEFAKEVRETFDNTLDDLVEQLVEEKSSKLIH